MILLTILTKVKMWLLWIFGAIVLFLTTYGLGIFRGRKQIETKDKEQQAHQEQVNQQQAQDIYKSAEEAAQSVPNNPTPNPEKRDDLDTTK